MATIDTDWLLPAFTGAGAEHYWHGWHSIRHILCTHRLHSTPNDTTVNMGSEENKSEILGLDNNSDDNKDKEGELVALDYDIDTSKGERALKVCEP